MDVTVDHVLLPHVGWMRYERGDAVARYLRQGWFESEEQAFLWLYLREGDVVVDCGAHAGLFSVLAGKLVGPGGRVVSIEPSPGTAGLLRENLAAHGLAGMSTVLESAAGAGRGKLSLVDEGAGKSAFNHVGAGAGAAGGVTVGVDSLEALLGGAGVQRATFLKVDVEGAELDVWAGARGLIERGALPVVMVEFTEANLRRVGRDTGELYRTIEGSGYRLYRFDGESGELVARPLAGPIWYENLFAVRDVEAVNARLREAEEGRRRVAWDLVQRGKAGMSAREADERAEQVARLAAERDEIRQDFEASREQVSRLKPEVEQARMTLEEMRASLDQARAELKEARGALERAWGELGATRAERDEARRGLEAAVGERQAARVRVRELTRQLKQARAEVARNRERLRAFCTSKYERLSWALGIRSKPVWVDEVVTGVKGDGPRAERGESGGGGAGARSG